MKIKIDIDCTPGEARAFLGLPDVGPMQEAMLAEMQERMREAMRGADMESLMQAWMPAGMGAAMPGWDAMQKAFWAKATEKDDEDG
ncbi:MAG: DUF6489 family protein [Alphaproteobacteria bacterium]|jgi:hypothetical protein|nr:DUF6489 family protein [Alphaproteobacteria bacterium]MDP6832174.1 DUF6489 family protein [Alphaproteobacteria bacterium]